MGPGNRRVVNGIRSVSIPQRVSMSFRLSPWCLDLSGISSSEDSHYAYFDPNDAASYISAFAMLENFIELEGPFDGVIGFSQGAGLAIMYMAKRKVENPRATPPWKCAVLFSPTAIGDPFQWLETGEMRPLQELPGGSMIDIPTTMIWGNKDGYAVDLLSLKRLFWDKAFWHYVFDGGHELPSPQIDSSIVNTVKLIRRVTNMMELQGRSSIS
jgi:pimeloyl-ACP methyl ester carboxylesterase